MIKKLWCYIWGHELFIDRRGDNIISSGSIKIGNTKIISWEKNYPEYRKQWTDGLCIRCGEPITERAKKQIQEER